MIRRMVRTLAAAALAAAGVAGYVVHVPAPATRAAAVHCQREYGHARGQAAHWQRICQP